MSETEAKTSAQPTKSLDDLQLTDANPRKLPQGVSETMDRSIDEFGSLDGIIYNAQLSELVGGNQRTIKFRKDNAAVVVITHTYSKPTAAGTVVTGYVEVGEERWPYREVKWGAAKHRRAVYAANKVHANWDTDLAAAELGMMEEDELLYTGFTPDEVSAMLNIPNDEFPPDEEEKQPSAKRFTKQELKDMASVHFNNGGPNDISQFINGLPGEFS